MPHILKSFYDEDILEEETILEWHDKVLDCLLLSPFLSALFYNVFPPPSLSLSLSLQVSKKHVGKERAREIRDKAIPIIQWLKTAEEESSDEEGTSQEHIHMRLLEICDHSSY